MENKICPMMSRSTINKTVEFQGEMHYEYKLFEIDCQKEKCALWVVKKYRDLHGTELDKEVTDHSYCGMTRGENG